ncbi:hypothetical protein JW921_02840 [Candidatus Fermentibacterales bacterium]|nr:hypothetical protein [Candidatus Fermentibacterales bacterium]
MSRISLLLLIVVVAVPVALAGPRIGGRAGYFSGGEPRAGDASGPAFGGQFVLPILGVADLEVSALYASSETDITLENYLMNYIEEEEGVEFGGSLDSLLGYLEQEWGWTAPDETEFLQSYTATYHDLDLAATLKLGLPLGSSPIKPYIGGGAGAHFIVSDADLLIQYVQEQTGEGSPLDVYDHVHPGIHGVVGASLSPPALPVSFFAEYKYTHALGEEAGAGGISQIVGGVNLGL